VVGLRKGSPFAICRFCDTDFVGTDGVGGGTFQSAGSLADAIATCWPEEETAESPFVVFTGGEPALQLDTPLIEALRGKGFEIAIETNGTRPCPGLDWVCVSPRRERSFASRAEASSSSSSHRRVPSLSGSCPRL